MIGEATLKVVSDAEASSQVKLEFLLRRIRAKVSIMQLADDTPDLDHLTSDATAEQDFAFMQVELTAMEARK